jgi:hypothetical protein
MVSSGEIAREQCGHDRSCRSNVGAPPKNGGRWEDSTEPPARSIACGSQRLPRCPLRRVPRRALPPRAHCARLGGAGKPTMRTTGYFPFYASRSLWHRRVRSTMDANLRHQLIRHRIREGILPRDHLIELGHGPGFGHACAGCGEIIETNHKMTVRMCSDDWGTIRLHDECFQIWDVERRPGVSDI